MIYNKKTTDIVLIGGSENGKFKSIYDYKYNDKELDYYCDILLENKRNVLSDLLKNGDSLKFYDKSGKIVKAKCNDLRLGIWEENFTPYLTVGLMSELDMPADFAVGISCDWNVLPRKAVYSGKSASVDIDGNGEMDKISWEYTYDENSGTSETKLTAVYNGEEFTRDITIELPVRDYSVINILDLNGDGKLEIIEYTYSIDEQYYVLGVSEKGFSELVTYGN
jgi:hypothetical protein